jgi:transposase-like protein
MPGPLRHLGRIGLIVHVVKSARNGSTRRPHLDKVAVSINDEKRYLYRAVDRDGCILDETISTFDKQMKLKEVIAWI